MAEIIRMPRMSDTMEEGVIASWLKKVGDVIKSGDVLAEVETDKATMELESYDDGVLLYIGVDEKNAVPVDGLIAIIGSKDENVEEILSGLKEDKVPQEKAEDESEKLAEEPKEEDKDLTSEINAVVITMPRMSDTMTEGTITSWHKKVGEQVKSGDVLAEVETDKATMELEAYEDGNLLYIGVKEGESVMVDGILAVIGEKGADYKKLIEAELSKEAPKIIEEPAQIKKEEELPPNKKETSISNQAQESISGNGRVKASPLAKKLAEELGYNIGEITGSGDFGRIIKRDVEAYSPGITISKSQGDVEGDKLATIELPKIVAEESFNEVSVSQMRKTIAKRLAESKFSAPHFYLTMEINMDRIVEARISMNEVSPVKISFNDLIIKAAAAALRRHPKVNASWLEDKIRYNNHIHIGVAVAVEEGLLVPVVRFADNKSVSHIAAEVKDLGAKAKNKQLQPNDWEGNTFTISNLGMFGIEEFTAIINPPDACIMAVGGIKEAPIVKNGEIVPGKIMKVTLSCDHRVVDGATGAAFLQTFKELLEDPVRILI